MTPEVPLSAPAPADPADEAARLRQAIAERDDLLAMAAHELRNPLHALTLQLSLARTGAEAQGQAETAARIAKAQATLARYVDRVTVLLDLARLNANAYPLEPRPVDLSALLRGMADAMTHEAEYRGVRLELDVPPSCPARLDALIVEQILDNLLLNAFKHAACSTVTLRLRARGEVAQIVVADDGRGIAAGDHARVFHKFGTASATPRGPGTGLGLWIVLKLIDVLGGSITLESAPGTGSVFTLTLPLSHPDGATP